MKKLLSIFLALVLCLSLCACSDGISSNSKSEKDDSVEEKDKEENDKKTFKLEIGAENSVADYVDFTLFKISTSKKVTSSLPGYSYYENDNPGETYVDIVLDLTNTSSNEINSDDIVVASAKGKDDKKYTDVFYCVETDNMTSLNTYQEIAPLSKARLHCVLSVPENETDLTLKLSFKGTKFTCRYTLGKTESNAKPIAPGDILEEADFAALTFNGIEYTDDLLPPNTSSYYTHYEVDDTSNTYLAVKFDLTSYMGNEKECDSFVGIKATYMDKYTYTGFIVTEDKDGTGYSSYESISPLSTRHLCCLIEVPDSVTSNDVTLTFSFNGKEYTYTGK